MSFENYRSSLNKKLYYWIGFIILGLGVIVYDALNHVPRPDLKAFSIMRDIPFKLGFALIFAVVIMTFFVRKELRNLPYAKERFVEGYDERKAYVLGLATGRVVNLSIALLALGSVATYYYNPVIAATLLVCLLVLSLLYLGMYTYFLKRF